MPLVDRARVAPLRADPDAVTLEMLALAADTRKAYLQAVAAEESVRYMRQVMQAAEASAELARRMAQVGNFNKLQRRASRAFYADAALNLARAEQAQTLDARTAGRAAGAVGRADAVQPSRATCPTCRGRPMDLPDIEQMALAAAARCAGRAAGDRAAAPNLGLTRTTRFINVLEVGAIHNTFNDAPTQRGYEIGFELPLFDWGDARVAKAEAIYLQAVEPRGADRSQRPLGSARGLPGYRSAYDIARHYRDEIVPLRKRIAEENLLRYNGMLIGVFELLADAREQIASVNGDIESLRDFWLAAVRPADLALIGAPERSPHRRPSTPCGRSAGAAH